MIRRQTTDCHGTDAWVLIPQIEHAHLAATQRAHYVPVTDAEVIEAFQLMSRAEGIIPALESAHALAWISRERADLSGMTVLLNMSGRGDKDVAQMMDILG